MLLLDNFFLVSCSHHRRQRHRIRNTIADCIAYWVFRSMKPASWDRRRRTRWRHGSCRDNRLEARSPSSDDEFQRHRARSPPTGRSHPDPGSYARLYNYINHTPHTVPNTATSTDYTSTI